MGRGTFAIGATRGSRYSPSTVKPPSNHRHDGPVTDLVTTEGARPGLPGRAFVGGQGRLRPLGRIAKDARGIHASRHPESKPGEPTTAENWIPTIPAKPRAVSRVGREEQRQRQQFRLRSESLGQKVSNWL